ncbi:hypothetical protein DIS24_g5146 [Lasiodiplodia hormozganensis]|uniref:Fungal STAND N-terminal Goodbye domain-containing protein n=1 Tax=Lasiodiplodia hormozganensis TaxID=869390 RepID=A0AA39YN71_9PEZI|nr:hypothetical protein DIS24_g5146 [Lasiodiplodia hormozganensis]
MSDSIDDPDFKEMWKSAEEKYAKITGKHLSKDKPTNLSHIRDEIEKDVNKASGEDEKGEWAETKNYVRNIMSCIKGLGEIAAKGASVRSNEKKRKTAVKALFRYDDGVIERELDSFRTLVGDEQAATNALTYEAVLNMGSGIKSVLNLTQDNEKRKDEEKYRTKIRTVLAIDENKSPWHSEQKQHSSNAISETGSWLLGNEDFKAWEYDRSDSAKRVIALEAEAGFGKSYLSSVVIKHLQTRYDSPQELFKTSVAYYYFKKDERDMSSVEKALNAIVWQLSERDFIFRKWFAGRCDTADRIQTAYDLWESSLKSYYKQGTIFYLVIDGIGHADKDVGLSRMVRDILRANPGQSSVRLLLTGRKKDLETLEKQMRTLSDEDGTFGDLKPDEWRQNDAGASPGDDGTVGKGSFTKLLVKSLNEEDIQRFVSKKMEDVCATWEPGSEMQSFRQEVERKLCEASCGDYGKLNFILKELRTKVSREEIEETLRNAREDRAETISMRVEDLNKSLDRWQIENLNEILPWIVLPEYDWPYLKQLKAVLYLKHGRKSLVSLEKLIEEKFSSLLEIDDDIVMSVPTMNYFRSKLDDEQAYPKYGPPNLQVRVQRSEIDIVRKFLEAFCDTDLFNRFGFEAVRSAWLVNLDSTDGEPSFVIEVLRWFKDPEIAQDLDRHERDQVRSMAYNTKKAPELFKEATKLMASRWLCESEWRVIEVFMWLHVYLSKFKSDGDTNFRVETNVEKPQIHPEMINAAKDWAEAELELAEPNPTWNIRLAETFMRFKCYDETLEQCRIAKALNQSNLDIVWLEVQAQVAQHGRKDNQKALDILETAVNDYRRTTQSGSEPPAVWEEMLDLLGDLKNELGHTEEALKIYKELVKEFPTKYGVAGTIITQMRQQEDFDGIIGLLKSLKENSTEELNYLTGLYLDQARSSKFHNEISLAGRKQNQRDFINEGYRDAETAANSDTLLLAYTRYYYALNVLYHSDRNATDFDKAIELWEKVMRDDNLGDYSPVKKMASGRLAESYLALAKEAGWKSADAVRWVRKLEDLVDQGRDAPGMEQYQGILLARAYYLAGREDDAKDCVRGFVRDALYILEDDDPENDKIGFLGLLRVLIPIDGDNARTANYLCGPVSLNLEEDTDQSAGQEPPNSEKQEDHSTVEKSESGQKTSPHRGEHSEEDPRDDEELALNLAKENHEDLWFCDGGCGKEWIWPSDLHLCQDCLDTVLDSGCFQKLNDDGMLETRVCHSSHSFLSAPKWQKVKTGYTLTWKDGERQKDLKKITDWLQEIKKKYL